MFEVLIKSIKIPEVRKKIIITLILLGIYRFLAHIPVPMVNFDALKMLFLDNTFLNFLNLFTGGGLTNLSIVALGIGPYINASIFMQLVIMLNPKFEEMVRECVIGRQKINLYTQLLTLPIALVQAYTIFILLNRQDFNGVTVLPASSPIDLIAFVIICTGGAYLLMWLGELITEKGIGNGISILVFAGILSGIPGGFLSLFSSFSNLELWPVIVFAGVGLFIIAAVVYINESYRRVEVHYSSQSSNISGSIAAKSYIPIKINQSGVFPIIFAVSLVLLPGALGGYLQQSSNNLVEEAGFWLAINFQYGSIVYNLSYFLLVFLFTFFYTNVAFNPQKISDDIRRQGGFIPGIRPGKNTVDFLRYVINRLTFAGGLFLGAVAILPSIVQNYTGIASLAIGGTSILIVVSVVLETIKQIQSSIITKEYSTFVK